MSMNRTTNGDSTLCAEELDSMEQAAEAASPGPWEALIDPRVDGAWVNVARDDDDKPVALFDYRKGPANQANARFVAHARTAVPRLCDEVRRLNRRIQELLVANTREVDARVQAERRCDALNRDQASGQPSPAARAAG
jgi:hypothetical protein